MLRFNVNNISLLFSELRLKNIGKTGYLQNEFSRSLESRDSELEGNGKSSDPIPNMELAVFNFFNLIVLHYKKYLLVMKW